MDFTSGQNLKKLKLNFWAKKSTNIVLEYTNRCGIATWGGGMFSKKSLVSPYFHEKILISNSWDYNGGWPLLLCTPFCFFKTLVSQKWHTFTIGPEKTINPSWPGGGADLAPIGHEGPPKPPVPAKPNILYSREKFVDIVCWTVG